MVVVSVFCVITKKMDDRFNGLGEIITKFMGNVRYEDIIVVLVTKLYTILVLKLKWQFVLTTDVFQICCTLFVVFVCMCTREMGNVYVIIYTGTFSEMNQLLIVLVLDVHACIILFMYVFII